MNTARLRPFDTYRELPYSLKVESTNTAISIDEEYWLALRHPAETKATGFNLLATNSVFAGLPEAEQDTVWKEFRAFIRQADAFYHGGCVVPWKSNPLNFYYAFLNLAKALALARGVLTPLVSNSPRIIRHGLTAVVTPSTIPAAPPTLLPAPGRPHAPAPAVPVVAATGTQATATDRWAVTVQGAGEVFPLLYSLMIEGGALPRNTILDVRDCLRYVRSIGWQLGKSNYGSLRNTAAKFAAVADAANEWDLLCVPHSFEISQMPGPFGAAYEEIALDDVAELNRRMGLKAGHARGMRFLQRATPTPRSAPGKVNPRGLREALISTAPGCFSGSADAEFRLTISLPLSAGTTTIAMNELLGGYAVLFFLSFLVRYQPAYMDSIGESADAWLIESFARAAPTDLLRQFSSAILGYDLIITAAR